LDGFVSRRPVPSPAVLLFWAVFTANLDAGLYVLAILPLLLIWIKLMVRSFAVFVALGSAALGLAGCATIIEKPTQDLKIEVAGTGEALCDVTQSGRRYRAYAPSTISVHKERGPLSVRCFAPGNREKTIVLESEVSDMVMANASNGVLPGMMWDATSGAMYKYPDRVVVDFTGMPPQPYPLPDYQRVFEDNPTLIGMEEFRPGKAALIRDMGTQAPSMQRREEGEDFNDVSPISNPAPAASGGSDADSLTRSANPQIFSTVPEEDK
jgi:hypothetical protein